MLRKTVKMAIAEEILAQEGIHQPLRQYILERLNAGDTMSSLAKKFYISTGLMSYWMAKMGIQSRYVMLNSDDEQ